ncbi:MAG: heavy-metal-associated domain-containing protein [Ignavibacteria bacterium]
MKKILVILPFIFIIISTTNSNFINNHHIYSNKMIEITLAEKTIKIKCTEMSCEACKKSITRSINQLKGITKLDIDLESKIITVEIDDSKTDEQSVLNAVIEAGYDAEIIK